MYRVLFTNNNNDEVGKHTISEHVNSKATPKAWRMAGDIGESLNQRTGDPQHR